MGNRESQHSTLYVSVSLKLTSRIQGTNRPSAKDSTLISTASGNTFARDATDWKWWHATAPIRIKDLNSKGYVGALFAFEHILF